MQENQNREQLIPLDTYDPIQGRFSRASTIPGEHHYDSYYEYCLSLIGFAVGFGSFWRFPYLVYKNGGGAFLIPYFLALFVLGVPMLYLETVLGQMHQKSVPFIFSRVNRGYKMLGATFLLTCFHLASYYNIILAYSYYFLFSAFQSPLPYAEESPFQNDYFVNDVLHSSSEIGEFGGIKWALLFFYILSLFICYLVTKNGVKTSGKIIMFTALMPYFFFVILGVRGLYLEGAMEGLKYLFVPDFTKLFRSEIWIDAIVQVFYQMTVAISGIINLSSMKPKKENFMIGIYIIPLSITLCGLLCAMNIFVYLGHFCQEASLSISDLQLAGAQLSFNIFPKALAILPWPNLWVFCFFLAMVFLGIDSEFGFLESLFCFLKDELNHGKKQYKIICFTFNSEQMKVVFMFAMLVFAPFLTSYAGIYYLQFFDMFVTNIPFSLGAIIEYILFVRYFPFSELQAQSLKYTGEHAPRWIQSLIEGNVVIGILLANLCLSIINQLFIFYQYSLSFYVFGWVITSYPYILAFIYYLRNREENSRYSFAQIKEHQKNKQIME